MPLTSAISNHEGCEANARRITRSPGAQSLTSASFSPTSTLSMGSAARLGSSTGGQAPVTTSRRSARSGAVKSWACIASGGVCGQGVASGGAPASRQAAARPSQSG